MRAPDYAQPFVGWRVWLLSPEPEGYRLKSLIYKAAWEPGRALRAVCLSRRSYLRRRRESNEHEAPDASCQCGIYATEARRIREYLHMGEIHRSVACAIGRVSLWGTVLECEHGWRASAAYPKHIYLPVEVLGGYGQALEVVALDLAQYGVPVALLERDEQNALLNLERAA